MKTIHINERLAEMNYSEVIDLAEQLGWAGDNGWESCEDPADDQSDLADAMVADAIEHIKKHR
jgi:hypothetical protein